MKIKLLFILIAAFTSKFIFADVIMPNTHHVNKCVKITNVEDYPDVSFLVYVNEVMDYPTYVVSSADCLTKGYKYNVLNLLAVNKSYLAGKDISKVNWLKDVYALPSNIRIEPEGGYMYDSIPIVAIEEYYKIVGFSETKVILYKWKQVTKYNNGKPDLTENFAYNGEVSPLYQKITVGINIPRKLTVVEIFPNPAHKNIHLRINDSYKGTVPVELINAAGKVMKTLSISKPGNLLDYDISVTNATKGVCFVKVQIGEVVEYKKVIIQ